MKKKRDLVVIIILAVIFVAGIFGTSEKDANKSKEDASTSKEDVYFVEKKDIATTLQDTGKGVVAILKNKSKCPADITATLVFKKGKKMIGSEQGYNYCLEAGKECSVYFPAPMDENFDYKKYDNYEISLDVDKTGVDFYAVDSIEVSDDCDGNSVTAKITNKGKKKLENIHLSIIYYDKNKNAIGWDEHYPECKEGGSEDYFTFDYLGNKNLDSYKVYVDFAYSYDWEL